MFVDQEQWEALRSEAAEMTSTCPICGAEGNAVHASFLQATRQEPCRFLGFASYCRHGADSIAIADSYPVEAAQLVIS